MTNNVRVGLFVRPVRGMLTVTEFARRAEELGFDSLWSGEHIAFYTPTFDSLALMAVCAGATQRIEVGTAVLLMPLRHPVWVQKSLVTLDYASGGRSVLGVGLGGGYEKEFSAVGVSMKERGPRTDEGLELLKKLLTEDHVTFHGRFFHVDDLTMEPKPVRKPHPPILIAGNSQAALRRTVRSGDGWMPSMLSLEGYRKGSAQIDALAGGAGRDPKAIQRALFTYISMAQEHKGALDTAVDSLGRMYNRNPGPELERNAIVGTPSECLARLQEYAGIGVSHFIFHWACRPNDIPWHMDTIAKEILPRLKL